MNDIELEQLKEQLMKGNNGDLLKEENKREGLGFSLSDWSDQLKKQMKNKLNKEMVV